MITGVSLLVLLIVLVILFKITKKIFKFLFIFIILGLIWLMHPVCQINISDDVILQNLPPKYIYNFIKGQRTFTIDNTQSYCKTWISRQFFF